MKKNNTEVLLSKTKNAFTAKYSSKKYPYAEKTHHFLELKNIRMTTFKKQVMAHGIPEKTFWSFMEGHHEPKGRIIMIVQEILGIAYRTEDFEEKGAV